MNRTDPTPQPTVIEEDTEDTEDTPESRKAKFLAAREYTYPSPRIINEDEVYEDLDRLRSNKD